MVFTNTHPKTNKVLNTKNSPIVIDSFIYIKIHHISLLNKPFVNYFQKFFLDNQSVTDMFFCNMRKLVIVRHLRQPQSRSDLT
jgi:hypothetical protein